MDSRKQVRKELFWHDVFLSVTIVIMISLLIGCLTSWGEKGIVSLILIFIITAIIIISILWLMRKSLIEQYNIINNFYKLSEKYGFPTEGMINKVNNIAHNSRITHFCENGAGHISDRTFFHFWKKDDAYNFLEMPKEKLLTIPEKDLISYTVTGDKKYITKVTGGGGGGNSLGGAVVGGMLGGATGAVIGSRKATQPITTDVITVNNQNTIVNCMVNGESVYFVFTSGAMYDELMKLSPAKELNMLSKASNYTQKTDNKDNLERLKELKEILDNGLISSKEYQEKKKEILSEI